jgi:hypothetical protein
LESNGNDDADHNYDLESNGNDITDHNYDNNDNLNFYDSENENESDDSNSEHESVSDNMPKTFDGTKFNLNWSGDEHPFGFFNNFTNVAMFIWVIKHMICKYFKY